MLKQSLLLIVVVCFYGSVFSRCGLSLPLSDEHAFRFYICCFKSADLFDSHTCIYTQYGSIDNSSSSGCDTEGQKHFPAKRLISIITRTCFSC